MSALGPGRLPSWALVDAARIETDAEGRVVAWNDAAEELYGYASDDAIGKPVVQLIVPSGGRRQAAEIMQNLALGRSWEGEFDVRRRDGREVRVLVHDEPRYDEHGAIAGIVGHSVAARVQPHGPGRPAIASPRGRLGRALRRAMFDPTVAMGTRTRSFLVAAGLVFELAWALVARWTGPGESVGLAGAVAILGVLVVASCDVKAGVTVAVLAGAAFVVLVGYAEPPEPTAHGSLLVAFWAASALGAGMVARRLRAQAQRGMAESVALHRELVGSLVPSPRLRRGDVSVASLYRPGEERLELGGDFYAATERADGSIALLVGDVSGHGPAAAAMASMLRAAWEGLIEAEVPPQVRLASLNRLLLAHAPHDEFFATVCSFVIDASLASATVTLAGHPAPLVLADGELDPYAVTTGVPLGVSEAATWTPARVELAESFSVLLYTDGVVEGRAARFERERFGDERLRAVLAASRAGGRELLQEIMRTATAAHGGPLPDDAALLLLERREAVTADGEHLETTARI